MLLKQNSVIDVSVDFRQPCLRGIHQHGVTPRKSPPFAPLSCPRNLRCLPWGGRGSYEYFLVLVYLQ